MTMKTTGLALIAATMLLVQGCSMTPTRLPAVPQASTAKADYVDASIMLSHDPCRAPTTHLERQAPIFSST